MNKWSIRRKRIALYIVVGFLVIIIGVPLYFFLKTTPTCFDGKQNADETGVDCGGSCKLLCSNALSPILIHGDPRILKIATSTFEVVASVENPNPLGTILKAGYSFKIYSDQSLGPKKIIQGVAYVPKASAFVVFQGPFDMGGVTPTRVVFEWDPATLIWEKDTSVTPNISIDEPPMTGANNSPRIDATVKNMTLNVLNNIEFVVLVYDVNDNIIGASKTFVDSLNPNESTPIVFTWPNAFNSSSTPYHIFSRVLPDASYIQ